MNNTAQAQPEPKLLTRQSLDDVFVYHTWTPEQIERGKAIRATAKDLAASMFDVQERAEAFLRAIEDSAIDKPENPTELYDYAQSRRAEAVWTVQRLASKDELQSLITRVNQVVMTANSAITFEAAQLVRDNPPEVKA